MNEGVLAPSMLRSSPDLDDLRKRSDLYARCLRREEFAVGAQLELSTRRARDEFPFFHIFVGRPSLKGTAVPDLAYLVDAEAQQYFASRSAQCKISWLSARYSDLAFLTAPRESRLGLARMATKKYLDVFSDPHKNEQARHEACTALLRALEIALALNLVDLLPSVRSRADSYIKAQAPSDPNNPDVAYLIYGFADLDRRRQHLDYVSIAQQIEELASQGKGRSGPGQTTGFAYGVAQLTKDPTRIARCGRRHAEDLISHAKGLHAKVDDLNARYWFKQAWDVAQEVPNSDDLREAIRLELEGLKKTLGKELKEFTIEQPLSETDRKAQEGLRAQIVEAGERWPEKAAYALLRIAPTKAESEDLLKASPVANLFNHTLIEDGLTMTTPGNDWRHKCCDQVTLALNSLFWPHILRPILQPLRDKDLLTIEILCRPFAVRGMAEDDGGAVGVAAGNLLRGNFVAASQLWAILPERLIRFVLRSLGKPTTVIDQSGDGEHESMFDRALEEYLKAVGPGDPDKAERLYNMLNCLFGWRGYGLNWRNRVAHGTIPSQDLAFGVAWTAYLGCVALVWPLSVASADETPPNLNAQ